MHQTLSGAHTLCRARRRLSSTLTDSATQTLGAHFAEHFFFQTEEVFHTKSISKARKHLARHVGVFSISLFRFCRDVLVVLDVFFACSSLFWRRRLLYISFSFLSRCACYLGRLLRLFLFFLLAYPVRGLPYIHLQLMT